MIEERVVEEVSAFDLVEVKDGVQIQNLNESSRDKLGTPESTRWPPLQEPHLEVAKAAVTKTSK